MRKAPSPTSLALVGPKRPVAAGFRRISNAQVECFSLEGYLADREAPARVTLCPLGDDVEADLAFLRASRERLRWPAPPRDIADAIAGLRTEAPPARGRRPARRGAALTAALLLEGLVSRARARAALASPARLWVVESVRCVRLSGEDLMEIARAGVRWSVLEPVKIVALVASPALLAARDRWRRLVPARAEVWPRD